MRVFNITDEQLRDLSAKDAEVKALKDKYWEAHTKLQDAMKAVSGLSSNETLTGSFYLVDGFLVYSRSFMAG